MDPNKQVGRVAMRPRLKSSTRVWKDLLITDGTGTESSLQCKIHYS